MHADIKTDTQFKKKVYRKLETSPIASSIKPDSPSTSNDSGSQKKIISTHAMSGLREKYKKTFLPLLIDVFELRQMIDNYKTQKETPLIPIDKASKSPEEIVQRLEELQKEIEESQRWCDGVILQISKGIKDARETLQQCNSDLPFEEKTIPFYKRIFNFKKT